MESHSDLGTSSSKKDILVQTGLTALFLPLVPRIFKNNASASLTTPSVWDKANPHAQALLKGGARTNKAELEENIGKGSVPLISAMVDLALLPKQKGTPIQFF